MIWPSAASDAMRLLLQQAVEAHFTEDGAGGGAVVAAIRFYRFDEPHASGTKTINMRHSNNEV